MDLSPEAYWEDVAGRYRWALEKIISEEIDFLGEAQDVASKALSQTDSSPPTPPRRRAGGYDASMLSFEAPDAELVERLRVWFRLKGDLALRAAADRLERLSSLNETTFVRPNVLSVTTHTESATSAEEGASSP